MKYKHFDEIKPDYNTNFTMLCHTSFVTQTKISDTANKRLYCGKIKYEY